MPVIDPVNTGFAALYAILTGDATLMAMLAGGVFQNTAPVGTTPDWLQLVNQAAPDTLSATGSRILTRALFQVKVLGPTAPVSHAANIRAAYARADGLLQPSGQPLRNTQGVLAIYRESMLPTDAGMVNGVQWLAAGGVYRVEV